ncbi:FAD-dependent monooxygenase [Acinetobacter towneri]|uniref:FAD-dependent monooxygenase n=1 Tax=Acinetobacter towneri TaxID=202956 RepID=UPI0009D6944D|nr:FAD-dependent monooxygenase [Acinetobacter towneri]
MKYKAKYVIGADGSHSIVRKGLNLNFTGEKYAQDFLLGDVDVDWDLDRERFRIFVHGERIAVFLPLYGQRSRIMTTDIKSEDSDNKAETSKLSLEELEKTFAEVVQKPLKLSNPDWLTHFRTHHRIVDRYRVGHVFVAGDAAHIHSPAGGQGMNTGLQDAANLAWKLAAVLKNHADDSLLDTYETERLPVAQQVIEFTDKVFNIAAGQTGLHAKVRDLLAPVLVGPATKLDFIQDKVFRKFGQLDIVYPESAIVQSNQTTVVANAGQRAPNSQISRHLDIFDLLSDYKFTVLAFSRKRLNHQEISEITSSLDQLKVYANTYIIGRLAFGRNDAVKTADKIEVFEAYGLNQDKDQGLVIVRPDGYIAWRSQGFNFDECHSFLKSIFKN